MHPVLILPVKNPTEMLGVITNHFLKKLKIIVIDDGSTKKKYFRNLSKKVDLITNKINKGKGYSIKKAIKRVIKMKNVSGVVIADSDGQHQLSDIERVINQFKKDKTKIILSQRNFKISNTPLKNYIGNKVSSIIFFIRFKIMIDTQCGLRAIPIDILKRNIHIPSNHYAFETVQLIDFIKNYKERLSMIKIRTIYEKKNVSYFNRFKDSYEIINQIIKQ